jgi:predicted secreted hydrolase
MSQWQSPHTHILYPSRWHISMPEAALDIEIVPLMSGQELHASLNYWEGAVKIQGTYRDETVTGYGYVELTGYDKAGIHDEVKNGH